MLAYLVMEQDRGDARITTSWSKSLGRVAWVLMCAIAFIFAKNITRVGTVSFDQFFYLIMGVTPLAILSFLASNHLGVVALTAKNLLRHIYWSWPLSLILFFVCRILFWADFIEIPLNRLVNYSTLLSEPIVSIAYSFLAVLMLALLRSVFRLFGNATSYSATEYFGAAFLNGAFFYGLVFIVTI